MIDRLRPGWAIRHVNIYGVAALAGVAGPLVLIGTDIAAALSTPGYSLTRDSISSLALTQLGWIQTIGFLAIGLLVEVFVAGLLLSVRGRLGFGPGIAILVCFGFGLLLIGAFRTDPIGAAPTIEGRIHDATAITVFWLFPAAVALLAPSLKNDRYWKGTYAYSVATTVLALSFLIVRLFLPEQIGWFGLFERILVANTIIWVEVIALRLLRLSLRRQRAAAKGLVPEQSA